MAEPKTLRTEDVLPVLSRVSWGAILAGAFVSLAVFVLLTALGVAFGLSVASSSQLETIGIGAAIWYLVTVVLALMAGGCVTTRCTAGENKMEAVMYGVILWGVTFLMTVWVTGAFVRSSAGMLIGAANAATGVERVDWQRVAKNSNLTDEQIAQVRQAMPSAAQARSMSTEAAWWSFAGIVLSMLAAIGGALLGAGPSLGFQGVAFQRTTTVQQTQMPSPGS